MAHVPSHCGWTGVTVKSYCSVRYRFLDWPHPFQSSTPGLSLISQAGERYCRCQTPDCCEGAVLFLSYFRVLCAGHGSILRFSACRGCNHARGDLPEPDSITHTDSRTLESAINYRLLHSLDTIIYKKQCDLNIFFVL